jgi:hypothetical protein
MYPFLHAYSELLQKKAINQFIFFNVVEPVCGPATGPATEKAGTVVP